MLMGLTLTNTQTRTCINISIIDDQLVEGNETFFVSLRYSEAPGGDQVELGKPNTTTVTIVDNDGITCTMSEGIIIMRVQHSNCTLINTRCI